jgi:threonine aldolase
MFYTFIGGGARFMFAWDAMPNRVDALVNDLQKLCLNAAAPLS